MAVRRHEDIEFNIFKALQLNYMWQVTQARKLFIKELTKQLVMPVMRKRHATPFLQKPIKEAMMKCRSTFHNADVVQQQQIPASKRKRYHICLYAIHRRVRYYCSQCHAALNITSF